MELKEYINIIKKELKLFISITVIIILAAFAYFYLRPVSYLASLTLNITRLGSQETPDFKYDDFYRLQADEKFAETLVQWLKDPRMVTDIFSSTGLDVQNKNLKELRKSLKAENFPRK
jgi:capsular polysaccharide biosynthesis protein